MKFRGGSAEDLSRERYGHDIVYGLRDQAVNDGDKSLVVADETIIRAAERNSADVVPMYYEMKKAAAQPVTSEHIYASMIRAYTGGNIGQISNDITKIWNTDKEFSYRAIQFLCMENNFVIDYAKTLYKPTRPAEIDKMIRRYTKSKVPHFFKYAKGKTDVQIANRTDSCINRLEYLVPSCRLKFETKSLGKFNPRLLLSTPLVPNNDISQKIIDLYQRTASRYDGRGADDMDSSWAAQQMVSSLLAIHPDIRYVTDVLVKELFITRSAPHKTMFWRCFGDVVYENLQRNLKSNTVMCSVCGRRVTRESPRQQMCKRCAEAKAKEQRKGYRLQSRI